MAACGLRRLLVRAFGGVLRGVIRVEVQEGVVSPMVVKVGEHGDGAGAEFAWVHAAGQRAAAA